MESKEFDKIKYNNEYNKTAYDRVSLMLKRGQKEVLQSVAKSKGETLNTYIRKAIEDRLKRDGVESQEEGDE